MKQYILIIAKSKLFSSTEYKKEVVARFLLALRETRIAFLRNMAASSLLIRAAIILFRHSVLCATVANAIGGAIWGG